VDPKWRVREGFEHIASPPWAANDGTFRATKLGRFWHISIVGVTVRRERRWTSAGATPARELVRSTRKQSKRQQRQRSCRSLRCKGSLGDSASVQAVTRVNAEQAPKKQLQEPTLLFHGEGSVTPFAGGLDGSRYRGNAASSARSTLSALFAIHPRRLDEPYSVPVNRPRTRSRSRCLVIERIDFLRASVTHQEGRSVGG
jgi:hypothetical protein